MRYGFGNSESILDEWNYGPSNWKKLFVDPQATRKYFDDTQNAFGAAFDSTVMIELQDAPLNIATFFSGTTFMWGLFTSSGAPQKAYYSFLAFRRMLETPERISVQFESNRSVSVLAGASDNGKRIRLLVANLAETKQTIRFQLKNLPWTGTSRYERQVIDSTHDLEPLETGTFSKQSVEIHADLAGPSVNLYTVTAVQ